MEQTSSDGLPLEKAEEIVSTLHAFSTGFVAAHGIESVPEKQNRLQIKLEDALTELDDMQLSLDKAVFFRLRGMAINVLPEYDARAVECLSKAVKLDPACVRSWNALGECYWKNKDMKDAMNCFSGALKQGRDKEVLRNMSMVLRQIALDAKERLDNIKESVKLAKEAVALDVSDGMSWFVLGNAFLSLYFNGGQSPGVLRQCLAAYQRASADRASMSNPDLYFNRGVAHKYLEAYAVALQNFEMASKLDPLWPDPKEEMDGVVALLSQLQASVANKGHLKPKKFKTFVKSIRELDLGPYQGGSYTSPTRTTVHLEAVKLASLSVGENLERVISGKVVAVMPTKGSIPFAFILADEEGDCIAVTIYNLAVGREMLVGDSVAMPEPFVQDNAVSWKDESIVFRSIRVDNPVALVVNRRKVGLDRLGFSVLSVTNMSS